MTILSESLFPKCLDLAEEQWSFHWLPKEISLAADVIEYSCLHQDMKNLIIKVFSFFTQIDLSVGDSYSHSIVSSLRKLLLQNYIDIPPKDVQIMCTAFSNMENIHATAYQYLADTLGIPNSVQFEWKSDPLLYNKIQSVQDDSDDITSSFSDPKTFIRSLATFIMKHEGMTLFSIFGVLYAYTEDGLLKGSQKIVRFSMKDESLHIRGVIYIIKVLLDIFRVSEEGYLDILEETKTRAINEKKVILDMLEKSDLTSTKTKKSYSPHVDVIVHKMSEYLDWLIEVRYQQLSLKPNFSKIKDCPIEFLRTVVSKQGNLIEDEIDFLTEENTNYSKTPLILNLNTLIDGFKQRAL